jgi:hypothetical protein
MVPQAAFMTLTDPSSLYVAIISTGMGKIPSVIFNFVLIKWSFPQGNFQIILPAFQLYSVPPKIQPRGTPKTVEIIDKAVPKW